jgi:hypothetical protein
MPSYAGHFFVGVEVNHAAPPRRHPAEREICVHQLDVQHAALSLVVSSLGYGMLPGRSDDVASLDVEALAPGCPGPKAASPQLHSLLK